MNWAIIEGLIQAAKAETAAGQITAHLGDRQILSNSRLDPYYTFLRGLAQQHFDEPGVFLEIGCYQGCLAAHICEDAPFHNHKMAGIDINPVPFEHPAFTLFQGDSTSTEIYQQVKAFAEANGGIFAIFHDSSHHYYPSVDEFNLYRPLLRPGGIWISDDITPAFKTPDDPKSMAEWWDDLPGDKRHYDDLHIGSRIGVILT
jgi:predicted O-methyltransferase YrrM